MTDDEADALVDEAIERMHEALLRHHGLDTQRLRMILLPWVQGHRIQRYSDGSVLSHNEAVNELADLIRAAQRKIKRH